MRLPLRSDCCGNTFLASLWVVLPQGGRLQSPPYSVKRILKSRLANERDLFEPHGGSAAMVLDGDVTGIGARSAIGLIAALLSRHFGDAVVVGHHGAVQLDGSARAFHGDLE